MTDEKVDALVEAIARPGVRKALDELPLEVGQVLQEANAKGTGGGPLAVRVFNVASKAIDRAFEIRCEAELDVHRRLKLPFTEARRQRVSSGLIEMIERGFRSLEVHAFVRNDAGVGGFPARGDAAQRLAEIAGDRVAALAANLSLPRIDLGQPITVNVNAPNHGIVAAKIDSLYVTNAAGGRELQEALRQILAAVEQLEERDKARANEARELITELMHQAETRPQPVLVRSGAARLRDLLSVVEAGARVVELVEKLPHLIHHAASSGWIPG